MDKYGKNPLGKGPGMRNSQTTASDRNPPPLNQALIDHLNVMCSSGNLDTAFHETRRLLEIYPASPALHFLMGIIYSNLGNFNEAIRSYNRSIQLKPDNADAYNNLGNTLNTIGKPDDALKCYNLAIQYAPHSAGFHANRGMVLRRLSQITEAIDSYKKSIELKPDFAEAYNNCGNALKDIGRLHEAINYYDKAIQLKPDYTEAYSGKLFTLNYIYDFNLEVSLAEARKFGAVITGMAADQFSQFKHPAADSTLRVGFVSGDLRSHPVGFFLESILSSLDPEKIEMIAYTTNPVFDAVSERIRAYFRDWKTIYKINDEAAARLIHDDGLHVLVDLSGHTAMNRLPVFAWRPAPIQVTWLGYFATTGVEQMDYLIGDPYVTPVENDSHFTEKLWRLPETRWCFTPPDISIEPGPLPAHRNAYITFGCFNNLSKLNDQVVELWANLLLTINDSRLFLKAAQLYDPSVRESLIGRFHSHGIDGDRIILEGYESREKYFSAYHRVDIALDPFPFPGGTTSVETLWMGVPVLTLNGNNLVSRQGVGILMNAGLPDWICQTTDEYIEKAADFASNLDRLATLRGGLRQKLVASPLFDAQRFAGNLETALLEMWRIYNAGENNDQDT